MSENMAGQLSQIGQADQAGPISSERARGEVETGAEQQAGANGAAGATTRNDSRLTAVAHGTQIMIVLALFGAMLFCLHAVADVFTPIFLALTLVLAVRPISRILRRHHVPGWLAATITFLVLVMIVGGMVSLTVWSFTPLPQTLMNFSENFQTTLNAALAFLASLGVRTDNFTVIVNQLNFNSVISWVWSLIDSFRSVGGLLAIVVIALFFLTVDTTTLTRRSQIIHREHSHIAHALEVFEQRVRQYWIISTVFGLIVAVIDVFVLVVLRVPLPLTWGMWAFITNYIPNIGFVIGVIPPMIMGLVDSGWQTLVWVIVLYSVINVVIQTFIQPKFTGDVVGLSPSVTFISLVLWTSVVGWLGSLLAVPLTLFFKALLVDSDPRSQWLDVFLVSETDARRRDELGIYTHTASEDADIESLELPYRRTALTKLARSAQHLGESKEAQPAKNRKSREAQREKQRENKEGKVTGQRARKLMQLARKARQRSADEQSAEQNTSNHE